MKHKLFALLILAVLIPCKYLYSQRLEGKSFTLFNYNIILNESFKKSILPLESAIKNPTYKGDKLSEAFTHMTFAIIKEKLETKKEVFILPANSFQDEIKYNEYGYPEITIQKAIKKSDTRLFIKIYVVYNIKTISDNSDEILPEVSLDIAFFNDLGYVPIKKFKASAHADAPMKINNEFLYGFDRKIKKADPNTKTLVDVLNKAIDSIIESI